ncbi:GDSL-type esterase/lipase family protein [Paenibacillus roseipurpureus]|uniref:GDSL-type esterase/lipase family protein n=1 Tax=Paenibacillus roseopurpureus TaxID=2918901 RepID=A0AA96RK52_9BACL|nr:GDSL-type esterase/lipase family protein [Paenibacillus sp. MBLB1832]WNR43969.1 GDSL-type esterase/lipase family protein [Paenibacillus sp. MBLB1832]
MISKRKTEINFAELYLDHIGFTRDGLKHIANKLTNDNKATVAFIGGSVTEGEGASDSEATSYRALTYRYLERRFPETAFKFINAAIGGTNSTYGAFRLEEHVFDQGDVDLLFVEFAVNDAGNLTESIRAMEGIVRHAKRSNPQIDICFIYTARRSGSESYSANRRLQDNIYNHEEVAEYYRIPSVNIASVIYNKVISGELKWEDISGDDVHPNDFGYALYASVLEVFLENELIVSNEKSEDPLALPSPIDSVCYENGRQLSPLLAETSFNWRMIEGWTTEQFFNWAPPADIYLGESPGAEFQFSFTGTAVGISLLAGKDTGNIEVSIDGGAFRTIPLFDRYCSMFYRPIIVMFSDHLERRSHTVNIRISSEKHEMSRGHEVHILKLLVNE